MLARDKRRLKLSQEALDRLLDALCLISEHQRVYFLWRPCLANPKDDHVLELAVASQADAIVTHNTRHFHEAASLGVKVWTPRPLLEIIK